MDNDEKQRQNYKKERKMMSRAKESAKYINQYYPNIPKCVDCYYYRNLTNGSLYIKDMQEKTDTAATWTPACHYGIENNECRDCMPGEFCDKFTERNNQPRKRKPVKIRARKK
jgi:nitrate reductase cytochrome c-type subunit